MVNRLVINAMQNIPRRWMRRRSTKLLFSSRLGLLCDALWDLITVDVFSYGWVLHPDGRFIMLRHFYCPVGSFIPFYLCFGSVLPFLTVLVGRWLTCLGGV